MKIFNISLVLGLIFLSMYLFYDNTDTYIEPSNITKQLNISPILFNITEENFQYTDLYNTEPNIHNVMFNILHGIIYSIIIEVNTLIPVTIYIASGESNLLLMKIIIVYFLIMSLFLIIPIIKSIISIYFFIKERKKYNEKWWY